MAIRTSVHASLSVGVRGLHLSAAEIHQPRSMMCGSQETSIRRDEVRSDYQDGPERRPSGSACTGLLPSPKKQLANTGGQKFAENKEPESKRIHHCQIATIWKAPNFCIYD
ncbi:hypothetical protein CAPTEDRAFT_189636 [Capitella teleta]|uniref:Uncharacterized protein n=1 Tax=Capitella teleta TaxID=283909 RepID=R7T9K1_CAPTE|nr:hypothetical protein CAPTEDRAFT_189636 [Capitella teleta]|eukprot:ELT90374.1 hypothetical protein CAPTEDRAFT_189636 [Capitella teleta]